MTTVLVLSENISNIEVYSRSTWFHFELDLSKFSGFLWKSHCKKKKIYINYFDEKEKPWIFFKISQKKNKNFKGISVLDHLKPKIFFVGQPWWPTFFQTLTLNYFSAATALSRKVDYLFWVWMNSPKGLKQKLFYNSDHVLL